MSRYTKIEFFVDHPNVIKAEHVFDWHTGEKKTHVTLKNFSRIEVRNAMRSVGKGLERLGKGFPRVKYKAAQ